MAKDEHNKAAEHHDNAAKSHRAAADQHGKAITQRAESTRLLLSSTPSLLVSRASRLIPRVSSRSKGWGSPASRASTFPIVFNLDIHMMSSRMPPVPPANRSHKGTGDNAEASRDTSKTRAEVNTAEQGDTANVRQNTTNAGFFKGRRVK